MSAKLQVSSMQVTEVVSIRRKLGAFESKQLQYREKFSKLHFFKYGIISFLNFFFTSIYILNYIKRLEIDFKRLEIDFKRLWRD